MRRLLRSFAVVGPLALVGLCAWVVARDSLAETARDPALGEGPLVQVADDPDLGRHVRAAVRLPYNLEAVWHVVTDESYADVCPYLHAPAVTPDPDRTSRVTGRMQGLANTFPLEMTLREELLLDEYRGTWDGAQGDVLVNRGRWVVRRTGPDESVVEIAVAAEVRGVPVFLTRGILRGRLAVVLRNLHARLDAGTDW